MKPPCVCQLTGRLCYFPCNPLEGLDTETFKPYYLIELNKWVKKEIYKVHVARN